MKWLNRYFPWERQTAYLLGVIVMCIAHFWAYESAFFSPVLFLLAIAFIGFAAIPKRQSALLDSYQYALNILLYGAILVFIETIRRFLPNPEIRQGIAIVVSIPLLTALSVIAYKLLAASKSWIGKTLFIAALSIVFLGREPFAPFLTALILLTAAPFSWTSRLARTELNRIFIIGVTLLFGWLILVTIRPEPIIETSEYSFVAAGIYALGSTLFRIVVYSSVLTILWRLLKPTRIRTRLRWAFLLNFFVPFGLLLLLSTFSVIYLVGGYNAAASQRIIGQYGTEAAYQAQKLYEAFQGLGTPPPGEVPFNRLAFVRLADGTERSFGDVPQDIIKWLSDGRRKRVEFISIGEGDDWKFWVAGYHHDENEAGAVLAYEVDQTMLNRIRNTIGLELMLVKGQSFPWERWPDAPHIFSDGIDEKSQGTDLFNAGAASFYLPSATSSIQLAATLRIMGTREQFIKSLMLSQIDSKEPLVTDTSKSVELMFGTVSSNSINLESLNIWNLILLTILVGMLGVLAALVVLSLSTSFIISRGINRSVKVLKDGATALDRGDLDYRIPIISGDELGELAKDFNQMTANLKNYTAERENFLLQQVEKERLEEDLETARILQRSLLPSTSMNEHPALEIAADFRPMEEVGGDYYDYLWFRDKGIGLIIGDVSGHGMSAGLLMVMAKSCLVNQVRTSPGIRDVMSAINNMILDTFKNKRLMTFQYAVITPDGSRMRFASAGHQFPYLFRAETGKLEELESISYPLGVRRELTLDIREVKLCEGDCVILFTDGLVEAVNPDNEQLGYERLRQIFAGISKCSTDETIKTIMLHIDKFRSGAGQVDDMTLVVIRKRNEQGSKQ
ncbi:SpoIIE family protein phosphatase [bacterium]|nr:SpoIIE family protein phosphatase [bacterium]